jgi:hypothetical protein
VMASAQWTPFECDGRWFEYLAMPTRQGARPAGWLAHKASPARSVPAVLVVVRNPGAATGPGVVYPDGTAITTEHALETARRFWADLTG